MEGAKICVREQADGRILVTGRNIDENFLFSVITGLCLDLCDNSEVTKSELILAIAREMCI